MRTYRIITEATETNYSAYSPDVWGCVSTGKTVPETLQNMMEALQFHLETMVEKGEPLPPSCFDLTAIDDLDPTDVITLMSIPVLAEPVVNSPS